MSDSVAAAVDNNEDNEEEDNEDSEEIDDEDNDDDDDDDDDLFLTPSSLLFSISSSYTGALTFANPDRSPREGIPETETNVVEREGECLPDEALRAFAGRLDTFLRRTAFLVLFLPLPSVSTCSG